MHTPPQPPGAPRSATPAAPPPSSFEDYYLDRRRDVLLTTFAVTGDLGASRAAVRDAFVSARGHWRKLRTSADPDEWVRTRAWSRAQRRAATHLRHREKDLDAQSQHVLDALGRLNDGQRKAVVLAELGGRPVPAIGRELGRTRIQVEESLRQATVALSLALRCEVGEIGNQLATLGRALRPLGLPRGSVIRRTGVRRHQALLLAAVSTAVTLALVGGWFVTLRGPTQVTADVTPAIGTPVSAAMLLDASSISAPIKGTGWTVASTTHNTAGTGLNILCQQSRFADDQGLAAWVRLLRSTHGPGRTIVQSVEVSRTPSAAARTYRTTAGWYGGCTQPQVHLDGVYRLAGIGDHAMAFALTEAAKPEQHLVVVVARSGQLTTTYALTARTAPSVGAVANLAATGMSGLCAATAAGPCHASASGVEAATLPASGGTPGMLGTVDLPAFATISRPWVGTSPVTGGTNLAATTCDRTDFTKLRATPVSRSYLIPGANLPTRFGITETYGSFATATQASALMTKIQHQLSTCEKHDLGSQVGQGFRRGKGTTAFAGWRVTNEINSNKDTITYWMGVAQVGRYVAQVNFTPANRADLGRADFVQLMARAQERLQELP